MCTYRRESPSYQCIDNSVLDNIHQHFHLNKLTCPLSSAIWSTCMVSLKQANRKGHYLVNCFTHFLLMKEQWEDLWMLVLFAKFGVIQHFMVVKHWSLKVVHFTKISECINLMFNWWWCKGSVQSHICTGSANKNKNVVDMFFVCFFTLGCLQLKHFFFFAGTW